LPPRPPPSAQPPVAPTRGSSAASTRGVSTAGAPGDTRAADAVVVHVISLTRPRPPPLSCPSPPARALSFVYCPPPPLPPAPTRPHEQSDGASTDPAPVAPPRRGSPSLTATFPPPRPPGVRSSSMSELGAGTPTVLTSGATSFGRSQSPGAAAKVASLRSLAWKGVTSLTSIILPGQVRAPCMRARGWRPACKVDGSARRGKGGFAASSFSTLSAPVTLCAPLEPRRVPLPLQSLCGGVPSQASLPRRCSCGLDSPTARPSRQSAS
jgi:hypothetical protein